MDLTQNIITLTRTHKLLHNSTQTSDFHLLLQRKKAQEELPNPKSEYIGRAPDSPRELYQHTVNTNMDI